MIALRDDCLLVAQNGGGFLPWSAEQLTLEVVGESGCSVDPELLKQAVAAVIHYFRQELDRTTITMAEFSAMLGRVLGGLGIAAEIVEGDDPPTEVRIADLSVLTAAGTPSGELEFCQRLRTLLREQLAAAPARVEFHGLRGCVKRLTGRKHWCPTCEKTAAWILEMIRGWFEQDAPSRPTALVIR